MAAVDEPPAATDAAAPRPAPVGDDELDALLAPLASFPLLILAVSGGPDSIALLHLVARWLPRHPEIRPNVVVATVDHGLREASRAEAEWVVTQGTALGFQTALLTWSGTKPATGIQDAARSARYRLLADLARRLCARGSAAVVTAHNEDDQAETLLMRLARGSGLDGLAGMAERRLVDADARLVLLRPLLGVAGARLRATLAAANAEWIEDPSNDADRFERVRLRKARALLSALGLDNDKLALSARRLARVRAALGAMVGELEARAGLDMHAGAFASFDRTVWLAAPEELRLRLLARLIAAFGGQHEPPRLAQLETLAARMQHAGFEGATLAGAMVSVHADAIRVAREAGRLPLPTLLLQPGACGIWDRRFRVAATRATPGPVEVRALGAPAFARLRQQVTLAPELPAAAAAALPAFWRGSELLSVPYFSAAAALSPDLAVGLYSAEFVGQGQSTALE